MKQKKAVCVICRELLPIGNFRTHWKAIKGFSSYCIDCGERQAIKQAPSKFISRLKSYGLTEEAYQDILTKQNNRCAICQNNEKALVIDHDHDTGVVRGLLCKNCNLGLGSFKDHTGYLDQAITYLLDSRRDQSASN